MATPAADRGRRDAPPPVGLTWAWDRSPPAPLPAAGAAPASGSPPSLPAAATPSSVALRSTGSACTARPASASAPPFPRSPLLRNNTAQSAPRPATHTAAAHSTSLPPDRSANDAAQSASPDCFLPLQIHLQPAGLFVQLFGQRFLAFALVTPPVREDPWDARQRLLLPVCDLHRAHSESARQRLLLPVCDLHRAHSESGR